MINFIKVKKKPVDVEAFQLKQELFDKELNGNLFSYFTKGKPIIIGNITCTLIFGDQCPDFLLIPTLEGVMRADMGDWIIKGVNNELYPCKDDTFRKTYEIV